MKNVEHETPILIDEAAALLGLRKQSVYNMVNKKTIPHCKRPGQKRVYFFKSQLIAFIREAEVPVKSIN